MYTNKVHSPINSLGNHDRVYYVSNRFRYIFHDIVFLNNGIAFLLKFSEQQKLGTGLLILSYQKDSLRIIGYH